MTPLELRITNFRSFRSEQCFTFPRQPGLYFLGGENKVEPELEANGSGKSSLWEALCWVLFGKTSRNLRAGDVCNWSEGEQTVVELDYMRDNRSWTLTRTWNPNTLALRETNDSHAKQRDISQEDLEAELGISFPAYLHSIFIAQFVPMFLDLGATDKTSLVSSVLNLDRWLDMSSRASARVKQLESSLNVCEKAIAKAEGTEASLLAIDYSVSSAKWEEERATRLQIAHAQKKTKAQEIGELEKSCNETAAEVHSLEEEFRTVSHELNSIVSEMQTFRRMAASMSTSISRENVKLDTARQQLHFFQDKDFCPVCSQVMSKAHRTEHTTQLQALITQVESEQAKRRAELRELEASEKSAEERQTSLRRDQSELTAQLAAKRVTHTSALAAIRRLKEDVATIDDDLERIAGEVNPFVALTKARDVDLADVRKRLAALTEEQARLRTEVERTLYWVKGFKDLRLFLISEALTHLELEVNSALLQLGLIDWKISFAVDAETKSGTLKRGFTVMIESPHNTSPVPWESWSGGESQRLRLAVTMGLSNLILNSLGVKFPLEVWDEPSTWLSAAGIEDLLETLSSRAHTLGKQIWVVDHRSLDFGGFAGTVTVVKDREGSKISP